MHVPHAHLECSYYLIITKKDYSEKQRRIAYHSEKQDKMVFLIDNFTLPAMTITEIYRKRWQIELFFKWIKQHLRIKAFYGTSENAVKTQILQTLTDIEAMKENIETNNELNLFD